MKLAKAYINTLLSAYPAVPCYIICATGVTCVPLRKVAGVIVNYNTVLF